MFAQSLRLDDRARRITTGVECSQRNTCQSLCSATRPQHNAHKRRHPPWSGELQRGHRLLVGCFAKEGCFAELLVAWVVVDDCGSAFLACFACNVLAVSAVVTVVDVVMVSANSKLLLLL